MGPTIGYHTGLVEILVIVFVLGLPFYLSKGSSYTQLKCESGSNSLLQNKWKDFAIGDSDSDRSHEEALPLLESFFFNNNTPGTWIRDDPNEITLKEHYCFRIAHNIYLYYSFTFQFCEIDLSEILSPDALSPFMEDIKKRERQRKQLARKVLIPWFLLYTV